MECIICSRICSNKQGLSRHLKNQHNFSLSSYMMSYIYGKHPICKCGCEEKTNWYGAFGYFRKYIKGHSCRNFKLSKEHKNKLIFASKNRTKELQKIINEKGLKTRIKRGNLKHTEKAKNKIRISMGKYRKLHKQYPNYNPYACEIIDEYGKKNGYNFQHAMNGGEFTFCGYWVDGYDKEKNVVIEYYEKAHNRDTMKKRDNMREKRIKNYLKCKFIIIKEEI